MARRLMESPYLSVGETKINLNERTKLVWEACVEEPSPSGDGLRSVAVDAQWERSCANTQSL